MAEISYKKYLNDNYEKITIAAIVVISVIAMILFETLNEWSDVEHFYRNISEVVDNGLMPYSETRFEYPPFLLVFFLIPKLLSWNLTSFCVEYVILSLIFFFLGIYFMKKILAHYDVDSKYPFLIYVSVFVFATVFVLCRNDVFVATMVLAVIWLYVEEKYWLAAALLGIATMTKLYPAILILILLIPLITNRKWKETICSAVAFAGVCLLVSLPFIIKDFNTAFDYLTYHSDRGIEIESLAGTIILIIDMIVPGTVTITYDQFQSYNLYGDITGPFQTIFTILMVVAILGFVAWFFLKIRKLPMDEQVKHCIGIGCAVVIMLFVIFNKVFSAQYVIWFFTLIPLIFIPIYGKGDRKVIMTVYFVTGIVFLASVVLFMPMTENNPAGAGILAKDAAIIVAFLRNVAVMALAGYLIAMLEKYTKPEQKPTE